jgi:hypothetical protein
MPPSVFDPQRVVFCAMSKRSFYLREHIIKFVLQQGFTPMSAFMMYSYFLLDTVERTALIQANNELIRRSDELWVFGPVSDGVQAEIDFARRLNQPIRYFVSTDDRRSFVEISEQEVLLD